MFTVTAEIGNKCLLTEDSSGQNANLLISKRSEIQMYVCVCVCVCVSREWRGENIETEIWYAGLYMEKKRF